MKVDGEPLSEKERASVALRAECRRVVAACKADPLVYTAPAPARTAVFADTILVVPGETRGWHRDKPAGNVALLDGHVEFHTALSVTNLVW